MACAGKGIGMKLEVYRHYKGRLYLVLGVARQTETNEELVIYVPLYELERGGLPLQARPRKNWDEPVDGKPRFEYVGETR